MSMTGKVAIVAGGGRDIGAACAVELASRGASVLLTYHASATTAQETVAKITAAGGKAVAVQADLTEQSSVDATVKAALSEFGAIDCLVHVSGGLVERKKITEMDLAHWKKVLDVNLTSLFLMSQAVIPHMKPGSSIVTFSSQAARDGGGGGAIPYATSKGAVSTFTRGLAKELGPNIRVNSVCPGMISTGFHDTFTPDAVRTNVAGATCIKREGTSEEVAKLVGFLADDDSSYMTGNNVDINGGLLFS
ncbi:MULTISPECIES: SDR family NAD(P)-dependent oxidoreductase [Alteromonadaceae]|uniref:SDR family NAD(P)-dependent oxidoreductase n=1 Tax=Alteromonadaceae TaxID=72275 RepID=UPI001C08399D|nr:MULTISPECIES: SDR family oxidoreductase [Aliiglaciecola]MBU2879205.1 SDR family oxidoreductase [Aliiglaciecola lipolytica]MDO6712903.1 SDR family oxidoreductase [Aliiglaciecola sp. 2_MG-2023]MDO6752861.1 SDR family oxidoreductase [Aliiglaciecola sp. 1_MG-2023]